MILANLDPTVMAALLTAVVGAVTGIGGMILAYSNRRDENRNTDRQLDIDEQNATREDFRLLAAEQREVIKGVSERLDAVAAELRATKTELGQTTTELGETKRLLTEAQARNIDLEQHVHRCDQVNGQLKERLQALEDERTELLERVADLEQRHRNGGHPT